jgi:putative ABC transport system permease protein
MITPDKDPAVRSRAGWFRGRSMNVPHDMRYGLRKLNHNVGFTFIAVSCLALGICASVTVFSVVNSLLLRPIPGVVDQDRLVSLISKPSLAEGLGELADDPLSYPLFSRYRREGHSFSGLVAYQPVPVNLVVAGEPLRLQGQVVTENYFTTLGLRPALGSFFSPTEAREAPPEAVVSHALWQRYFTPRQGLGSNVSLNGHTFVVIGVAPPGFRGPQHQDDLDVWMPIETAPLVHPQLTAGALQDPENRWLFGFFGRLAPGADLAHAQREMDLLASRFARGLPPEKRLPGLQLYPSLRIRPGTFGDLASPLALLAGVVGLLMLVVCANLGGLLLVKAAARQEEIGVRLALGVTRGQLVRQLLAESVTLALAGGATGFVLSLWTVEALQGFPLGRFLPRMQDLSVDGRVVAFTAVLSLVAGVTFGLVPALWSTRRRAVLLLRRGGDGGGLDRGRTRLQEMFVIGQVMVSLMLLVTTGLFVRTLKNLQSVDPGFDSAHVLNVRLNLALDNHLPMSGLSFYEQLLAQVRRLPGVRSASLVSWVPVSKGGDQGHYTNLRPRSGDGNPAKDLSCQFSLALPGYFRNLRIPLLRGRDFSPADRQGSTPVVIVDETLAGLLWPGRDPVGERVDLTIGGKIRTHEVVGLVHNVRRKRLQEKALPYFYLPLSQFYEPAMILQVRTAGDPLDAVDSLRSLLRKLAPFLGVEVSRYDEEVEEALAQPRLFSWLFSSFSLTALLVTAIGLYGTLAYAVSCRTRELGIRIALGARGFEIVAMVLWRGLAMTIIGLVLGLAASVWATSLFSPLLFGVTPTDPGVFVAVALLLTLVGLAASSLPAYSATRVDPMAVIRHE